LLAYIAFGFWFWANVRPETKQPCRQIMQNQFDIDEEGKIFDVVNKISLSLAFNITRMQSVNDLQIAFCK